MPYAGAAAAYFRRRVDGKVIIDIANPVAPDLSSPHSSSGAQKLAKDAPAGAHVVKAFNARSA